MVNIENKQTDIDILQLKYSEIIGKNNAFDLNYDGKTFKVAIVSNIICAQINAILELSLKSQGLFACATSGDYNNIVQDSKNFNDFNLVIIFFELSNVVDGLHYKIGSLNQVQIDDIYEHIKSKIDLVFENLAGNSFVIFNKFTSLLFNIYETRKNKYDDLVIRLNAYLDNKKPPNVTLIEIDKVISCVGVNESYDARNYTYSKALYTVDFFKNYVNYIKPIILSANGKSKKVLIMDCDNTLWKGILGEDGFKNIQMSSASKDGSIYENIQNLILSLVSNGVILCLVSKNELADVDDVLDNHSEMLIKQHNVIVKRVNWKDKATNIREIADELNVGLESFVFVDDSTFEIDSVQKLIPEITVFQVPKRIYHYPKMFMERVMPLFQTISRTVEDSRKSEIYKDQALRNSNKSKFANIEDYLASLKTEIFVDEDNIDNVSRISQLTQKTNQFNLSTYRYTEGDIRNFMDDKNYSVLSISVTDRFGDNGLTGVVILRFVEDCTVEVDSFLLSCRIIGRNVEYAIMDYLVKYLKDIEINVIKAKYIKSSKNNQVLNFYDTCGFESIIDDLKGEVRYNIDLKTYKNSGKTYIVIKK